MKFKSVGLFVVLAAYLALLDPGTIARTSPLHASTIIKRASSAIAITSDGLTLLTANPDSNSITLVDAVSRTVLSEITVGVDPRCVAVNADGSLAYVSNRGSRSLSVVNLSSQLVIATLETGYRPYGVVSSPDGRWVYLAEQGEGRVIAIDAASLEVMKSYPTAPRPSGLAISADGHRLYVTHLLDKTVTILIVQPFTNYLPLAWQGGLSVDQHPAPSTAVQPGMLQDEPVFPPATLSLWPDSNLAQSAVISPDEQRLFIPHTRSNTGNRALTFDTTVFPLISIVGMEFQQHLVGQQLDLGTLDPPGVGLPFDAAFTPDGQELWVVNAASNNLSVINLTQKQLVAHIPVGDNPRGIVLAPDGSAAFVNNTLAGTVSVIDTSSYTVTEMIMVTHIPLPPTLLNGKRLFNSSADPRLARARWISCNTCHFEGEHDGRTWFFGFAGPRNTTSLFGMIETYPLRWSGEWNESADAEFANRKENFGSGLIDGEMYCTLAPPDCVQQPPNQGRSYDLDSLAEYIDSLVIPLSPAHAQGQPLSPAELRGQTLFLNPVLGCVACHPPPLYTDLQMHNVGTATIDEKIGTAYDTPSLRGLYMSAPYFHDGSALTLYAALTRPSPNSEHDVMLLSEAEIQDLIAFLLALPYQSIHD